MLTTHSYTVLPPTYLPVFLGSPLCLCFLLARVRVFSPYPCNCVLCVSVFSPCLCSCVLSLPVYLCSCVSEETIGVLIGQQLCWQAREQQAMTPLTRHNTPSSHVGWKLGAKRRTHRHRNWLSENLGISNIDIKATFA